MQSDEELMRAYQEGSEEAFNQLFTKYSPVVYGYLKKRIRFEELDDLYQKVWRQVHEKRSLYRDQPFAPWLFVLMKHLMIDEYRSLGRKKERDAQNRSLQMDQSVDPSVEVVEDLLKRLPEESANLVRRYYLEDDSYEDLERDTGLSQTNLRQRLSRAMRSLRKGS